ncbi:adenylyltransferase/cytidyltransferase family protein [Ralstonia solanacearum]|uniref:Bifunctional nmn adenylyltransferase/nudix transferase protein n=1 Tax=Ralstonia solanacearum IPO1609 TaxID=564066 RepID=A0A7U7PQV6_RALSL|nr:bifunctional nmn adenylyltransferase/nudix transferase protein [Ralstonia solanacearum IPO1609]
MSTNTKRFDALVFIGRFQPLHRAHIEVLRRALSLADTVCVLIGSTDKPRNIKDPFSFDERRQMILSVLSEAERERVRIAAVQDSTYNDSDWLRWVQGAVAAELGDTAGRRLGLIGHEKDSSSYYLRMFPQWELVEVDASKRRASTENPRQYFAKRTNIFLSWAVAAPGVPWKGSFPQPPGVLPN